jgi:Family of unknown function (DUF5995)
MTTQKPPPGRAKAATNGAQKPKPAKTTAEKSAVTAPVTPIPWEPLEEAKTIDDVVRNFDQVIDWAIRAESTVGYFAILYKRSTLAVHEALKQGKFTNPQRMQKFDVVFAQRYFDALNAYFMPDVYPGLTLPWEVAFVGHEDGKTTIIQQMITGLNAHICFDLGLAAVEVAANDLGAMKHDFDYINDLVALQVPGMLRKLIEISPDVVWLRRALPAETDVIKGVLTRFRDGSWLFAIQLAMFPDTTKEKIVNHQAWTAALGAWYLEPPKRTPFHILIWFIKRREKRNIGRNLRLLEGVADKPRMTAKRGLPIVTEVTRAAAALSRIRPI